MAFRISRGLWVLGRPCPVGSRASGALRNSIRRRKGPSGKVFSYLLE